MPLEMKLGNEYCVFIVEQVRYLRVERCSMENYILGRNVCFLVLRLSQKKNDKRKLCWYILRFLVSILLGFNFILYLVSVRENYDGT